MYFYDIYVNLTLEKGDNMTTSPAVKEIWSLIKETRKDIIATRKEMKESRRERQKEMEESRKEMEELLKKDRKDMLELRARQKQTDEQMRRTDIKLDKFIGDTGNRWGQLGENLVTGNLAQRLKEKGIKVEGVITNARKGGAEFDIIAVNGKEVVVVEVKATLDPSDVEKFKKNMGRFTSLWPDFKRKTIYGAIAYMLKANRQAEILAEKEGFFVISASGDVIIKNEEDFKPKVFN